jgi:ABC-type multidrug transport system fused ATPase/permease subunit
VFLNEILILISIGLILIYVHLQSFIFSILIFPFFLIIFFFFIKKYIKKLSYQNHEHQISAIKCIQDGIRNIKDLKIYRLENKFHNCFLDKSKNFARLEHYHNLKTTSPIEYSAIKSEIISISKYLAKFYKNKNIRINSISPGGIKDISQPKLFVKRYKKSCNSKELLDGYDLCELVLFLLFNQSKYITGQNLVIDDGWSL